MITSLLSCPLDCIPDVEKNHNMGDKMTVSPGRSPGSFSLSVPFSARPPRNPFPGEAQEHVPQTFGEPTERAARYGVDLLPLKL